MFSVKNVAETRNAVSSAFIYTTITSTLNSLKLFNPMTFISLQFCHFTADSKWQCINIWNCSACKICLRSYHNLTFSVTHRPLQASHISLLYLDLMHACLLIHFSCVWFFVTLWTIAHQTPLFMGFSRKEYWNGLPCPPPGDLPDPGIGPCLLCFLQW